MAVGLGNDEQFSDIESVFVLPYLDQKLDYSISFTHSTMSHRRRERMERKWLKTM